MSRTRRGARAAGVAVALLVAGVASGCSGDTPAPGAADTTTTVAPSTDTDPTDTGSTDTDPTGVGAGPASPGPPPDALPGRIVEVVDGDTVRIDFGSAAESVRLIGVDTPEPSGGIQPPECHGDEASAFTRALLPEGTPVLVTFDAELRDRFDRVLGYVYRASDGLFVNLAVVENGFAGPMAIEPNTTFSSLFADAATGAERGDLGLWGACDGPDDLLAPEG